MPRKFEAAMQLANSILTFRNRVTRTIDVTKTATSLNTMTLEETVLATTTTTVHDPTTVHDVSTKTERHTATVSAYGETSVTVTRDHTKTVHEVSTIRVGPLAPTIETLTQRVTLPAVTSTYTKVRLATNRYIRLVG